MIYRTYGLLTQLVVSAFYQVIPIISIFTLFTCFFGIELYVLDSNRAEIEEYKSLPTALGYFFIAFGNGIGNIVNPSYAKFKNTKETGIGNIP